MDVQGVHGQVVGVQVELREDLLQGERLALGLEDGAVGIHAVRLLDEAQQVLLVHAGRGVDVRVHLPGHGEWSTQTGRSPHVQEACVAPRGRARGGGPCLLRSRGL